MQEENNQPNQEAQVAEPQQEQQEVREVWTEPTLMRKRPNIYWMGGTILFLAASLLIIYALQSSPIPTPTQFVANMTPAAALSANMVQLNQEYQQTQSSRGLYEIGAGIVAVAMGLMTAKNLYLNFRS